MTKEALQQALDALTDFDYDKRIKAIEIIKEALETEEGLLDRKSYLLGLYDQKPWVGLTDEEVVDLKMIGRDLEFVSMTALCRFARDIEAKLKERNT
jgi:hypothetical protein